MPLLGFVLVACAAKEAPPAAPPEPMLDALVVPLTGTEVAFAECPYAEDEIPPIGTFAAPELPEFRADRTRESNYQTGAQWRDDVALSESMAPVEARLLACVDLAACYADGDDLIGEIAVQLEVSAEGRVEAASVAVSDPLAVDPVVPCARKVLAELEFPKIDGGGTFVTYAVTIQ